ncbi:MAG: prepilin-type N-terminal cleavage/methylation domain-containing protein [Leptospirales bacterium]|jgi:prepilin-type N-terminal cleavage/methylation domain-containing protein
MHTIESKRRRPGLRRILRRFRTRARRLRRRSGFTLVEMALALAIASSFLVFLTANVSEGIQMQLEADRMTVAVAIAQAKLSQLRNNPNLSPIDQEGELTDAGMYSGYKFRIRVTEEDLDLAEIQQSGKIQSPALGDQLPAGVQNQAGAEESLGTSETTATGGKIPTMRILVVIEYPVGNGFREFRVETLQAARRASQGSGGGAGGDVQ